MPDDNEHDYQPTREEILERYGWKPGEREEAHAEFQWQSEQSGCRGARPKH